MKNDKVLRNDSILTPQDLKVIDKKIYEASVVELYARTICGINTNMPNWAETYEYSVLTRRGAAKIWTVGAKDVPMVDEDMTLATKRIYSIVSGFRIFTRELEATRAKGMSLDATRAITARRAIAEKENNIFFEGDATYGIEGLIGYTGITRAEVAATGTGGDTKTWSTKTPALIIDDIRTLKDTINNEPGLVADTLLLPQDQYNLLEKPVNDYNFDLTIKKYILNMGWFKKVMMITELDAATVPAVGTKDVMMALDTSQDVIEAIMPQDITAYPPEKEGTFFWSVTLEERYGGVLIRFPKGVSQAYGI